MEHGNKITFRKSTFSGGDNGSQCVEVGFVGGGTRQVMVRDSKHRSGAVLQFTQAEWDAFLKGVRAGEFG